MTTPIIPALKSIVGAKHVLTPAADAAAPNTTANAPNAAPDDLAPYLTDWRGHFTGRAAALVRPGTTQEVSAILRLAHDHHTPVVPQGGNTSLCGGATPDASGGAIILTLGRMNAIRRLDPTGRTMTVEAGCILANIQKAADAEGLLFPLDFGARGTCQIGGALATNAGGLNVVRYGTARHLCLGIEVVLADGRVMDVLTPLKKDNTGYDLKNLFIGSEGTLGVITAATLQLFPKPQAVATAFVGLRDIDAGIALLNACQAGSGGNVVAFEIMPKTIIDHVLTHYPDASTPFDAIPPFSALIEITSTAPADARPGPGGVMPLDQMMEGILAKALEDGLISDATTAANNRQRAALWRVRELIPESEIKAGDAYKSDISVPLEHMAEFYRRAATEAEAIAPGVRVFGFGHLGDGNLHFNLAIPAQGHDDFVSLYPQFDAILMALLAEYGGSISAEHGIGQKKRHLLAESKDQTALEAMRLIKTALDPRGIMNPGKLFR